MKMSEQSHKTTIVENSNFFIMRTSEAASFIVESMESLFCISGLLKNERTRITQTMQKNAEILSG